MPIETTNNELQPNGGYPMHSFDDLKDLYYSYISNPEDRKKIEMAYEYAKEKHKNQFRKSGEPYIHHPLEVAYIVAQLQCGPETIIAAFLHDTVEDTDATVEEISSKFGDDVGKIVDAVTKIQRMKLSHREESDFEMEDHKKIFLGMAKDVRVIIVKLADRLHNMRTLSSLSMERKAALSHETLEVFAPIAHRLGIYTIQSELQDLCLKYTEPDKYNQILNLVNEKNENLKESLKAMESRIAGLLLKQSIPFRMEARVKSIYSIYRKMYLKGHSFDEIYDVLALRIITETEINCYEILGIIHQTYKPIPGRFKDYIAMPKPNMYQSLHTSIVSGDGKIYEVQIRTEEMDRIAETGVAAHWKYKEGSNYSAKEEQKEIEEQLHWFRDFVSMSGEENTSAKEYMEALSNDVFGANVYVFTPAGKVIDLPNGSTPLDFAFRVHTKVGENAVGAVVNGIGVPLNTVLKTGDVCEIRTSKTASGPNEGWLDIVKTASAKSCIRRYLQKKESEYMRSEKIKAGKSTLLDAYKSAGYDDESGLEKLINTPKVLNEYHCKDIDDLYVCIANRNPAPVAVIELLHLRKKISTIDLLKANAKKHENKNSDKNPVELPGNVSNLAMTLAQCCTPIPGDDIVGYITKGKGVTIHRRSCPNIANETKRLIDAKWKEDLGISTYPVDIEISAGDRSNLIADIINVFGARNISVADLKAHLNQEANTVLVSLSVKVSDSKVLEDCFANLLGVKAVYSVNRVIH